MNTDDKMEFSRKVGEKETRKIKAQQSAKRGIWFGFKMFGLVGWSVMIPTLLGTLLGLWIDKHYPGKPSWTLTFLILGLTVGVLNAWFWVKKESGELQNEQGKEKATNRNNDL